MTPGSQKLVAIGLFLTSMGLFGCEGAFAPSGPSAMTPAGGSPPADPLNPADPSSPVDPSDPQDPFKLPPPNPGPQNPSDADAGTTVTPPPPPPLPAFSPATFRARRLLGWQYKNAVEDLLGTAAAAALTLPSDTAVNGLDAIGAAQIAISSAAEVSNLETNAFKAAQAALAVPSVKSALVTCTPTGPGDTACLTTFVKSFGRLAFRHAMTDADAAPWLAIAKDAATSYADFFKGVEFAIAAMIQAPSFMYVVETGVVDAAAPAGRRVSGYEMATRLSLFLTGSIPNAALLTAAESGTLDTAAGIRTKATELLATPRAKTALWNFFDEFLGTRALPKLSKDAATFPTFNTTLANSMREQTRRTIEAIAFTKNVDARSLFDATFTFVDSTLATHYGMPAPGGTGFSEVAWPTTGPRLGVLTEAAFLTVEANSLKTSVVKRGKFVRENLFCEQIAAPPSSGPIADLIAQQQQTNGSQRALSDVRMQNAACAGCHKLMDPIGFGFEGFDAIGKARNDDATGWIDDKTKDGFTDARGLLTQLKVDPRVMWCLQRTIYRQATGHVEGSGEARPMFAAKDAFEKSGYKMQSLLVELAASDAFRFGVLDQGATP